MNCSVTSMMELTKPEVQVFKSCLSIQPYNNRIFNSLPSIAGVKPLSAAEIKKDLKEVEKLLRANYLTDDECLSDDVLQSSFPVKPRKTSRLWPRKLSCIVEDVADSEQNEEYLHQIVDFFKTIEKSNKELFIAEEKREALEVKYQAIKDSFILRAATFAEAQKQSGNYYRVIQGIAARKQQVHALYNRRNAVLYDLLETMKRKRQANAMFQAAIKAHSSTSRQNATKRNSNSNSLVPTPSLLSPGVMETSIIRIDLKGRDVCGKRIPVNVDQIVLYKGQYIPTAYGEACIMHLVPDEKRIIAKLGYGLIYLSIPTYLTYALDAMVRTEHNFSPLFSRPPASDTPTVFDNNATESLLNRWHALEKSLHLTPEYEGRILDVLSPEIQEKQDSCETPLPIELQLMFGGNKSQLLKSMDVKAVIEEEEEEEDSSDEESFVPESVESKEVEFDQYRRQRKQTAVWMKPELHPSGNPEKGISDTDMDNTGVDYDWRSFDTYAQCGLDISTDIGLLNRALDTILDDVRSVERKHSDLLNQVEEIGAKSFQMTSRMIEKRLSMLTGRGARPAVRTLQRNNKGVFKQSASALNVLSQGANSENGNVSDSCASTVGNCNGETTESNGNKESSLSYFADAALATLENNETGSSRSSRRLSGNGSDGVGIAAQEGNGRPSRTSSIQNQKSNSGKSTPTNVPPQPPKNNYNQTRTSKLTNITPDNITSGSRIKRSISDSTTASGTNSHSESTGKEKNGHVHVEPVASTRKRPRRR